MHTCPDEHGVAQEPPDDASIHDPFVLPGQSLSEAHCVMQVPLDDVGKHDPFVVIGQSPSVVQVGGADVHHGAADGSVTEAESLYPVITKLNGLRGRTKVRYNGLFVPPLYATAIPLSTAVTS